MERQDHMAETAVFRRPTPAPEAVPVPGDRAPMETLYFRRIVAGHGVPPRAGPGGATGPGPDAILRLQRTAGNRAVTWFLQGHRARAMTADGSRARATAARATPEHARPVSAARPTPAAATVAATEAVGLEGDDLPAIEEQVAAQGADGAAPAGDGGSPPGSDAGGGDGGAAGGSGGSDGGGANPGADGGGGNGTGAPGAAADQAAAGKATEQADDVNALSCIVFDGGVALAGVLADGDGTPVATRPLADLDPGVAEGIARAGVVTTEFSESAFRSLRALGFTDLGRGQVYPPSSDIDIEGSPPPGSGFKKQYRLKPTTTKDFSYKAIAAPAGTYDTGLTVTVNVGGQAVELKKLIEVTEDVASKTRRFEQEHVDDTVAAFQMSFQEAADAVNHFAGGPDGADPIYFRGSNEDEVKAYVESRLADYMNRPKLGGKPEDWVAAYKKLLALTISERDAKGTHSWSLARGPKVDRAAGTVTYQLNPPSTVAGASFNEISWDKV